MRKEDERVITTICFWWVGVRMNAPIWYFVILIVGLAIRFVNSVRDVRKDREARERLK